MRKILKNIADKSITAQRYLRWYRSRWGGYPDWQKLIREEKDLWIDSLKKAERGPKILIATSTGGFLPGTMLESVLGAALTLRGASAHFLLCDTFLPACQECEIYWYPDQQVFSQKGPQKRLCSDCFSPAYKMFSELNIPVYRYSEFIIEEEKEDIRRLVKSIPLDKIKEYRKNNIAIGEHAMAGTLRFYARGLLDNEPCSEAILRRYFKASLLTTCIARRLFTKYKFDIALFHHGIYVPQGLIGEAARRANVRVVNWNVAYRKKCFVFSHGDTYHHTLMSEPVSVWETIDWNKEREQSLTKYLKSRWEGTQDWIWFFEKPTGDIHAVEQEFGIDFSKPVIGMLTNVMWDAQLHYPVNVFQNMIEWGVSTIEYFKKRSDLQLDIRVHPAEIRGTVPSRQRFLDEINRLLPEIPSNVYIIPPENRISTYSIMEKCNSVIIYGTKMGVELTSTGIPVIVAGEAWIRNKGLTIDAESKDHYFTLLDRLPLKESLSGQDIKRARKYAHHFFFRRMIPVQSMEPSGSRPPYKVKKSTLRDLLPDCDIGLDTICHGILKGTDFVYDAHNLNDDP